MSSKILFEKLCSMFTITAYFIIANFFIRSNGIIYGKYSGIITDYEITLPRKVKQSGAFHSFKLQHSFDEGLHRRKRSTLETDHVHYTLKLDGKDQHLQLQPNHGLVSPGMLAEHRYGPNITDHRLFGPSKHLCHYHGNLRGNNKSRVAVSLCSGIVGFIKKNNTSYYVEPLEEEQENGEQLHVVYKRSIHKPTAGCDAAGDWWNSWAEEMYRSMKAAKKRISRSDVRESVPRYMELCVVSDLKFIMHHQSRNVEEYVLSMMNIVADYYHDESIGNLIDIVVVRLVFLHKEKEEMDLDISPNATVTLESFCKWQIGLNPKDQSHPNHHDIAVLLTRHDICSSGKSACGLLGLAYVGTACNPMKNCCINEDTGLGLALTVTHELGHNMGCAHDSPEDSGCDGKLPDGTNTIMAPSAGTVTTSWSNCSREFITTLLQNQLGECLLDEPKDQNYQSPEMPIGSIYTADQQCKFAFGDEFINCVIGGEKVCETLWCKKVGSKKCISKGQMVADGTNCGPNLWCFKRECLPVGQRPPQIDGGWSDWGGWTQCTRTCGGGVSMRQRLCINPKPKNGGKYCTGLKKEYKMCNTIDCEEGKATFREQQCTEHNSKPFKGNIYTWTPYPPPESDPNPCALYCLNEIRNLVKLEPRVKDGTRCHAGNKNTCIHGACIRVGCDWGIESGAIEDTCGECNGDGTRCNTFKEIYNNSKSSGYTKITTIPKGSKKIAILEMEPSDNMLAVGSSDGNIYFNDNNTEKLPGEYKLGGAFALYTKPDKSREEIHINGPLKEDLVLYYVFFKQENPGVEYKYSSPSSQPTFAPSYRWDFIEWSECTVQCGGGTQICKPTCIEAKSGKVHCSYCDIKERPEPKTKSCNLQKCRTRWKTWAWGPCSGCMYRTGERKRDVECVMELPSHADGDEIIVEESECIGTKPASTELCDSSRPCNATNCSNNRQRRWNNILDEDFINFSYNLTGVEDTVNKFFKRSTGHWFNLNCSNVSVPIIEDKIKLKDFQLKVVNLSDCNNELFSNMSEVDYETMGDKVPIFSAGEPTILKGEDAMHRLEMETNLRKAVKPDDLSDSEKSVNFEPQVASTDSGAENFMNILSSTNSFLTTIKTEKTSESFPCKL